MPGIPTPFGREGGDQFDAYDAFVPEHLPAPGATLAEHDVLADRDHVAFHRCSRALFEERTVYDMTFGYNLARLNLDARHPDAGYRYAVDADDSSILRAEFTPTTPFCPQTHTLTIGSFRAWNGLRGRHESDLVRVRAAEMHHQSGAINERLAAFEAAFEATGDVREAAARVDGVDSGPDGDTVEPATGTGPGAGGTPPF